MNLKENNLLVSKEITYLLIGSMIGIGIFNLPNALVKSSYESGWIPVLIGSVYPLYLGSMAILIIKKEKKRNILFLSKKCFGNIIGSLFNIVFLINFIFYIVIVISGFNNMFTVYATSFLTPTKIVSFITLITAFTSYKGLKVISKINTLFFYLMLIVFIIIFWGALRKGSYLNLLPIYDVSLANILKSVKEAILSYGGLEIIFLIYPSVKNLENIGRNIFEAIGITTVIYTLSTAMTIYYLGVDIIPKYNWSFLTLSESLTTPVINNFRFVFAFFWLGICLNIVCNYYFSAVLIVKDLFNGITRKNITIVLYFIITYVSIKLSENTIRKKFIEVFYFKFVFFVIIYTFIITLFVFIRKEDKL